ncbi:SMP-30/gluconolactonase/LRE family protein [Sphingomonas sp. HF-S3]|uniref:SMP-30/gluconolactonase/LRE family protein n=1 Tax=Sphingomonas rustica TaxID=3103142 RepID=A0ABV0B2H2_9SPHN
MAQPRVVARDRRDQLGEGPIWSARDGAVYWTDILSGRLNRLTLGDDRVESWNIGGYLGWVIERERGGFVAGIDRRIVTLDLDGPRIETLAELTGEDPGNRVNDAKADRHGRIWAGTMPVAADRASGAFYRLDTDGRVSRVDRGYRIANGPAIATDASHLFHTDSGLRTIFRFDINDDGSLGERMPFIVFEQGWGDPDGMTLDADGGLWVACWGAGCVTRFTPDGNRDRSIALLASQITSCVFAGQALDRMFVTSAAVDVDEPLGGALFEVDPGCRGLPALGYRG